MHLELVNSLNTEDCVLAIRRFVARRGLPTVIWSDNAKTFVATQTQLLRTYGVICPGWRFIPPPPRSPWWGGWWERLVRSVKSSLRKTLGTKSLPRAELETALHEVEACVNSRPLTFLGDETDDVAPLTPSCFLIGQESVYGQRKASVPEVEMTRTALENKKFARDAVVWFLCGKEVGKPPMWMWGRWSE